MFRLLAPVRPSCWLHQHIPLATRISSRRFYVSQSSRAKEKRLKWTTRATFVLFVGAVSLYLFIPDTSRSAPTSSRKPLSAFHFTPATVLSNETSGPDTKLLKLKVPPHLIPKNDPIGFEAIWSVYIKDDDIQVERPYTPLEGIEEDGTMLFWVKRYPKGEVGRWLHSKEPGDTIELRGPLKTWLWKDGEWEDIILISGGTGITPFYQLIHEKLGRSESDLHQPRFTLLHTSRTPKDLPPQEILCSLLSYAKEKPDRFKLHLFVDVDDGSKPPLSLPSLEEGHINEDHVKRILGISEPSWWQRLFGRKNTQSDIPRRKLFLVCGPEPMIAAIAGPYGRNFSQGPVRGILGRLGLTSKQVWKLS